MYLDDNYPLLECRKIGELIYRYEVLISNIDVSINNVETDIAQKDSKGDNLVLKIRKERMKIEYFKRKKSNKINGVNKVIYFIIKALDNFCHKRGLDKNINVDFYEKSYEMLNNFMGRREKYLYNIEALQKYLKVINDVCFDNMDIKSPKGKFEYKYNPKETRAITSTNKRGYKR